MLLLIFCKGSTALHSSYFGNGVGYFGNGVAPCIISGFNCSGNECSLLQCSQHSLWSDECFGVHKAGVVCLGMKY